MEDRYTETHQTWDHIAQLYEDKFMYLDLYDDTYQTFCDSLAIENASVLELGCGPGNITKHLLRLKPDLQILATDVSEQMIIRASKNNPGINARILDCRNLESIHQKFDGIMCGFTIPYLSKSDCKHLIYNCHQLLRENGILYLSFVPGDYTKSGFISGSTGERTYFYYHDISSLKQVLVSSHMAVSHQIEKLYPKSDGTLETHIILIAQKNINI